MLIFLKKHLDVVALVFWCLLIFGFSSVPSLSSGLKEDFLLRKIAHAAEYGILAFLFYNFFRSRSRVMFFNVIRAIVWALAYAFTDEVHQTFVPGRSGNFFDIGIDLSGIIVGMLIVLIVVFVHDLRV